MTSERTFTILEHTADKGIYAKGRTMGEAFEAAAYGMFSLFVNPKNYVPTASREVQIYADDREQLLWKWLSELIFDFEVEKRLPLDFRITDIDDTHLTAKVYYRKVGEDIEFRGSNVKAVTFHQLEVAEKDGIWHVQVYFDV